MKFLGIHLRWCKHRLRYWRSIKWYEDAYREGKRSKWVCTKCCKMINLDIQIKIKVDTARTPRYSKHINEARSQPETVSSVSKRTKS